MLLERQHGAKPQDDHLAGTDGEDEADHLPDRLPETILEDDLPQEVDLRENQDGVFCPTTARSRCVKCAPNSLLMKAHSSAKAAEKAIQVEIRNCQMDSA